MKNQNVTVVRRTSQKMWSIEERSQDLTTLVKAWRDTQIESISAICSEKILDENHREKGPKHEVSNRFTLCHLYPAAFQAARHASTPACSRQVFPAVMGRKTLSTSDARESVPSVHKQCRPKARKSQIAKTARTSTFNLLGEINVPPLASEKIQMCQSRRNPNVSKVQTTWILAICLLALLVQWPD